MQKEMDHNFQDNSVFNSQPRNCTISENVRTSDNYSYSEAMFPHDLHCIQEKIP